MRSAAKRLLVARIRKEKPVARKLDELEISWRNEGMSEASKEERDVVARLGKLKVVQEVTKIFADTLKEELGLEVQAKGEETERESGESASEAEREDADRRRRKVTERPSVDESEEEKDSDDGAIRASDFEDSDEEMEDEHVNDGQVTQQSGTESDTESIVMSNVEEDGTGMDGEDGWETNSDGEFVRKPSSKADPSDSFKSLSLDTPEEPKKEKPSKTKPNSGTKATTSRFLPTLMAGYISDPDSEASDDAPKARKNRRGQRARQAIWEKKYGDKAKHKQKELRKGQLMDEKGRRITGDNTQGQRGGKYQADGKSNGYSHGRQPGPQKGFGRGGKFTNGQTKGGFEKPEKERKKDDEGKLHPSWLAAKKKKEEVQKVEFKGKKITFD